MPIASVDNNANAGRGYVHLASRDGIIFLHQSECDHDVTTLAVGDVIDVGAVDQTPKGPHARGARFLERPAPYVATVVAVREQRGFFLARLDAGEHVLVPRVDYKGDLHALQPGERVSLVLRETPTGWKGSQAALVR